jgi:hypothetical protein
MVEDVISGNYHLNDFKPVHIDDSLELIEKYKTDLNSQRYHHNSRSSRYW